MKISAQLVGLTVFCMFVAQGMSQATNSTGPKYSGVQCYSCTSYLKSQECDDPSEKIIENCLEGETLCRKVEQHIRINGKNTVRTYRSCAASGDLGECKKRTGPNEFKSWYCQCEGNLCNGAQTSAISLTLMGTIVAALFVVRNRV